MPFLTIIVWITGLFVLLSPLMTFGLLLLKGLPSFAMVNLFDVLLWVYQATWLAALLAGILVSLSVAVILTSTRIFHQPYDFGRCFSLGAVLGALAEGFSTWSYRFISQRPFSSFWIAGAMMSGCIAGAIIVAGILWRGLTANRA